MMMDNLIHGIPCRSMDDSFGKIIVCRESKSISTVTIPIRTKHGLFHDESSPM